LNQSTRVSDLPELPDYLDDHQKEGVKWILTRRASYLAHAPGAGKTCQAITAALLTRSPTQAYQTLFIVPPTLTANWTREIMLWQRKLRPSPWATQYSITIIPNTARKEEVDWDNDWVICPDSMLAKPWVRKGLEERPHRWQFIAVDEASRFKEESAERTRVLFGGRLKDKSRAPGLVYDAEHVVLLDGSPMPNRAIELWAPTYALAPECIDKMNYYEFGMRFGAPRMNSYGKWEFKGTSNVDELRKRLRRKFMHVVTESELGDHPERLRSLIYMTKDARSAEHKKWESHRPLLLSMKDGKVAESESQGEAARFRRELGLRKVPWVTGYFNERRRKREDESLLVFAWHREVVEKLSRVFPEAGVVMGGTPAKDREAIFRDFQSGQLKMLIMNIAAAGRGHNLQRADRVIFAEYSWCDETNKQAEKRASRKGSARSWVRCEYIVSPGSMDEIILKAVMRKARMVEKVIG
jgi:SNF2 family DNA or RNA helicase